MSYHPSLKISIHTHTHTHTHTPHIHFEKIDILIHANHDVLFKTKISLGTFIKIFFIEFL